ncbi:MAG: hypothetical protein GOP50_08990 [Candidatus Heimdallarchaeota archaeon]|nr:hypothetical protein [Candidatus Heimdallarchaeota archaeon]
MIEEIRNLLQKIDQIADSESRRFNDEIEELKEKLDDIQDSKTNLSSIHGQVKEITNENERLKIQVTEIQDKLDFLLPFEKKCEDLERKISKLELKQEGYIFTIKVISNWIPSQKENIDVLVALASSPDHESTFKILQEDTTIPAVTLKNRIIPILEDNSLVKVVDNIIKLTITELEEMG